MKTAAHIPSTNSHRLSSETLLSLYEQMVLLRRFELAAQAQYKSGRMPGFIHLYIGQEAVACGVCAHLDESDWITSTHRGHGHAIAKGVKPEVVMAELYGKATGCNGGRGGSMHLYDHEVGLFGTNGFVGGGIPASVGVGLSAKTRGTRQVCVSFFGDGAVNHATFHESINLATTLDAPVLFVCENNLYATATPLHQATRNTDVSSRAAAYGLPGISVDGNDAEAMYRAAGEAIERARNGGGPTLLEARTYRTVGHHEGDPLVGTYRTQEELDGWKQRDPIVRLRALLCDSEGIDEAKLTEIDDRVATRMQRAVVFAEASPQPDPATANDHVWAQPINPPEALDVAPASVETRNQGWLEAVCDGIAEEMRRDPHLIYLGEGTGERGGSFGHTKGLWHEFGAARMIDTPICELGFTGAAIGAAASGCRAVADLMFSDFLFEAASQIIEQAGKLRYMTNGKLAVPMVMRAGMGFIKNAGPHHSGTYYPIWAHNPGLLVAVPSTAADAKGLWKTALRMSDPVIMLEHKMLFASKGEVPLGEHFVPFGQAAVVRSGRDITLVACGLMVHRSLEAAAELAKEDIECEVIDLRTIVPLDVETIAASVAKTGRLLIADEAFGFCGIGAEITAAMMELAFDELDAPIGRIHTHPVAHPFSPPLEEAVLVDVRRIREAAHSVIAGRAPSQRRAESGLSGPNHKSAVIEQPAQATTSSSSQNGSAFNGHSPSANTVDAPAFSGSEAVPLVMPNVDLTIAEATVIKWLKEVGETVEAGEVLLEVESTKAVYEVEAPVAGELVEILAPESTVVQIGQRLGAVRSQGL